MNTSRRLAATILAALILLTATASVLHAEFRSFDDIAAAYLDARDKYGPLFPPILPLPVETLMDMSLAGDWSFTEDPDWFHVRPDGPFPFRARSRDFQGFVNDTLLLVFEDVASGRIVILNEWAQPMAVYAAPPWPLLPDLDAERGHRAWELEFMRRRLSWWVFLDNTPPEPDPLPMMMMMGQGEPDPDEIRFTAISDVNAQPLEMTLRLEYGSNRVDEAWAVYSADWVPAGGWPEGPPGPWERASEPWTLAAGTNEWVWTDEGQLDRELFTNVPLRIYAAGSLADSDGDGLADGDEWFIYGTDPFNADTDGDWFSDGYEVAYDTDPLVGDSSPPFRMLINEGAYYWPSIELQITFEGVVADAVTIAEDFSFSNPVFMPLSFPSNTVTYTATPGTNPRHRVFAKLHRGAGEKTFAFMAIGLLDPTPPELVVTTPTNNTVTSDPWIAVAGHVIETNSTARVEVNGAYVDGFWGEEFRKARCRLVPGTNLLEVVATDRAGHSSTQVVVVIQDLALDTQAPTASLLLPEDFQIVQGATSWLGSTTFGAGDWLYVEGWSDDETARVELLAEQDGATNGPYSVRNLGTSFWGRVRLHEGANTLWLLAEDAAGNAFSTNYSVIRDSSFHIEIVEPAPYAVVNARSTLVRGVASPMFSNATIQVNGIPATLTLETDHVTFETDAPVPLNSGYTSLAGVAVLDGRSYLFDPPVLDYQILSWNDRLDSWFEGHIIKAGGCIEYHDSVSYYTRTWNHLDGLFAWTTWGWSSTYFDCGPTFDNPTFGPFGDSNAVETPPFEYILLGEEIYINELHDFDLDVWQPFRETGMTQIEFILPGDPGQENASARPAFFDFHGLTYDSVFSHSSVTPHDPMAVRFRGQPGFATENGTGFIVPIEVGTPQTISAGDFEWPSFSHVQPGGGTGSDWWSFAGHVLLFDTVDISVLKIDFKRDGSCSGFDDTLTPPWIMVPKTGDNTAIAEIDPAAVANQVGFVSADTSKATVSPATASASPQTVTVSGVAKGDTEIQAKPSGSSAACATLNASVKERIDKTIAIHAITEENDDVQVIPVGQGQPNQACITAGTNGVLNTTPAGDDTVVGDTITTGPDGICNTTASGDDVQVIAVGNGKANAICVTKGANNFRDTKPLGDDVVNGDDIDTGPDGICNTTANASNLVPTTCPTAAQLQSYLNDTIWGRQANVYFTVTRSDYTVNYDLDRSGTLAHPSKGPAPNPAEGQAISAVAKDTSVDYNIYYVYARDYSIGTTRIDLGETWTAADGANSPVNHTAHEVGHLLGIGYESFNDEDVMLFEGRASNPCRVIKRDWDTVNP